jgi:hypothetical protein
LLHAPDCAGDTMGVIAGHELAEIVIGNCTAALV